MEHRADERNAFRKSGFIRHLATAPLSEFTRLYLMAADEYEAAGNDEARVAATMISTLIETIAKYRYGDAWVRP